MSRTSLLTAISIGAVAFVANLTGCSKGDVANQSQVNADDRLASVRIDSFLKKAKTGQVKIDGTTVNREFEGLSYPFLAKSGNNSLFIANTQQLTEYLQREYQAQPKSLVSTDL